MSITPEFLEQLKSRFQLSSYIAARVKLKRKGRHMSGCCPFHSEKTPSFIVNDERGSYHCFGCGAHGDIISYLQQIENLTFIEVVEKLASLAGVSMPEFKSQSREQTEKIKDIYDLLEEAASFFQSHLRSNEGAEARRYLEQRAVLAKTQEQFRLGYAPANNVLKTYFQGKGYTEKALIDAGLLSQNEDKSRSYDRFRSRLMFPIWDRRGRVVAFGGRTLANAEPKYLNSPEIEIFHKSSLLYAYHFARVPAQESQRVVVCEGYMDVIALHQAGFNYAVAPMGTALTEEQIKLLWNLNPTPILCFDGDAPGQKAAFRAVERALPLLKAGYSLQFAHMPAGEDPDSLLQHGSLAKLEEIFQTTTPLVDVLWHETLKNQAVNTPEERAKFEKTLMDRVKEMKDPLLRTSYWSAFKARLADHFRGQRNRSRTNAPSPTNFIHLSQVKLNLDVLGVQHKILLAGLLNHPFLIEEHYEAFQDMDLTSPNLQRLRDEIISNINDDPSIEASKLQQHLYNSGFADLLNDILCDDVYGHASFVKPDCENDIVRQGWLEIWFYLQNAKKVTEQVDLINKKFQLSTSSLLKAKMRGDFN